MHSVNAQQVRSEAAFRLLQTAQSLMQSHQLDAAEQFFMRGLKKAKAKWDRYTEAYACQGLGTLFFKRQQHQHAASFYSRAARIYRSLKLPELANVVEGMLHQMHRGKEQAGRGEMSNPADIPGSVR